MLQPFPSTDVTALRSLIDANRFFVLVVHVHPDGDALGSSLGLAHWLREQGKEAVVIVPDAYPDFLQWMPGSQEIVRADKYPDKATLMLKMADVIGILDLNEPSRTETLAETLIACRQPKVLIDHHLNPREGVADLVFSRPLASSASELVFRLIDDMGGTDLINKTCAECLYTGMMCDTGGFTFNSNDPVIFNIISRLMAKGVDKDRLYNRVFHNYSEGRLRLFGYMLYENMRLYPEHRAALLTLTRKEMARFNLIKGDTEGLVNQPLQMKNVDFVCFLREDTEKSHINVSLRSEGTFPCNRFAEAYFNGGGHLNASGGRYYGSLDEAVKKFEEGLNNFDPKA